MIKCDQGRVVIEGTWATIEAELSCIIKGFREAHEEDFGEECTEETINRVIEDSKLSDEEIDPACPDNNLKKALDNLLDEIMKM